MIPVAIQKMGEQSDSSDLMQRWENGGDYVFLESSGEQEELASYLKDREAEGVKSVHFYFPSDLDASTQTTNHVVIDLSGFSSGVAAFKKQCEQSQQLIRIIYLLAVTFVASVHSCPDVRLVSLPVLLLVDEFRTRLKPSLPCRGEIRKFLELISIQAYVDGGLFLRGCGDGVSKEQPWIARRLCMPWRSKRARIIRSDTPNSWRIWPPKPLRKRIGWSGAHTRPSSRPPFNKPTNHSWKRRTDLPRLELSNPSTPIQNKSPGWRVGALGRKASGVRGWGVAFRPVCQLIAGDKVAISANEKSLS